jgi:hypothetical protein
MVIKFGDILKSNIDYWVWAFAQVVDKLSVNK